MEEGHAAGLSLVDEDFTFILAGQIAAAAIAPADINVPVDWG